MGSKLGPRRASLRPTQRVSVIGSSGSGKSTLARALAQRLSLPRLELDSIYHQPDWQPLATDRFRAQTSAFVAAERWVVEVTGRCEVGPQIPPATGTHSACTLTSVELAPSRCC